MTMLRNVILCAAWLLLTMDIQAQTDQSLVSASFFGGDDDTVVRSNLAPIPGAAADGGDLWIAAGRHAGNNLFISPDAFEHQAPSLYSGFFTVFNTQGVPEYSTFLSAPEIMSSTLLMATAAIEGKALIAGGSSSENYPLSPEAHNTTFEGERMGTLTCMELGSELTWSTFVGGNGADDIVAMSVHADSLIYIGGSTSSTDISTPGVYQTEHPDGLTNIPFIAKYTAEGEQVWLSYYGVADVQKLISSCAVSSDGAILYIVGNTEDSGALYAGGHQSVYGGGFRDLFLAAFSTEDGTLLWETYYGGSGDEKFIGPAISEVIASTDGNVYIAGHTDSPDQIATDGAFRTELLGERDVFIACFDQNGNRLWGSYYGGPAFDSFSGMSSRDNSLYIITGSGGLESQAFGNPMIADPPNESGGFLLVKWDMTSAMPVWSTYLGFGVGCSAREILALPDGKIVVTGTATPTCNSSSDIDNAPFSWKPFKVDDSYNVVFAIYQENTLSSSAMTVEQLLEVYPNPAREVLQVKLARPALAGHYTIFDLMGKVCMQGRLTGNQSSIALDGLPKGMYLLEYRNEEGSGAVKFVKE